MLCVYVRMRGRSYSEFKKAIIRKSLSLSSPCLGSFFRIPILLFEIYNFLIFSY